MTEPVPRPSRRTRLVKSRSFRVALATVAILLGLVALAAAGVPNSGPIQLGDEVTYHFTVYDENNDVLYTTDPEIAASEIDSGNAFVEPTLNASTYTPRRGVVAAIPLDEPDENYTGISPSRYMLGYREGDVVQTPFIVAGLGKARHYEIPTTFGPVTKEFTWNLTTLYNDANAQNTTLLYGAKENFVPGYTVAYAEVLQARVLSIDGDHAQLVAIANGGERVPSRTLGFDLDVELLDDGKILLHSVVTEDQVFLAAGCKLPVQDLPQGYYRVVSATPERILVKDAPPQAEHLLDKPVRFNIEILQVTKPSSLSWLRG